MRKMVYRNSDGTVVNTMAEADAHAVVELVNIIPFDEVEAREKWEADREKRRARRLAEIAKRS